MKRILMLSAVLFGGCDTNEVRDEREAAGAPLTIEVRETQRTEHGAQLVVVVRKLTPGLPVEISWRMPDNVSSSSMPSLIEPQVVGELRFPVTVGWSELPAANLVVTARMRGESSGATARASYSFGRAAPPIPEVRSVRVDAQVGALRLSEAALAEPAPAVAPPAQGRLGRQVH